MAPCPPCYIRVRAILRLCYIRLTPLYQRRSASERRGGKLEFTDFSLKTLTRIWPSLSDMYRVRSTAKPCMSTDMARYDATCQREFKLPWRKAGLLISMIKWILTRRLSTKMSLSTDMAGQRAPPRRLCLECAYLQCLRGIACK